MRMLLANVEQTFFDPDVVDSTAWIIVIALALAWVSAHWCGRFLKSLWWRPLTFVVRTSLCVCFLWALIQTLGRFYHYATPWPIPVIALLGAGTIEIIHELYRGDTRIANAPRLGRSLVWLRALAVVVILIMLLEPVAERMHERDWDREVIVMVDDSESMGLVDEQLDPTYAFDIAEFLGKPVRGRSSLWAAWRSVNQWEGLVFSPHAEEDTLERAQQHLQEAATGITHSEVVALLAPMLDVKATPTLELAGHWRVANQRLLELAEIEDELLWASLDTAIQETLTAQGQHQRSTFATMILTGSDPLLETLDEKYALRVCRFGDDVEEIADWRDREFDRSKTDTDARLKTRTNYAQALEYGLTMSSDRTLAGVILLSDGRHNVRRSWEETARVYGARKVPIGVVALGSRFSPLDAKVTDVHSTPRIYLKESVNLEGDLAFSGMKGQEVTVNAYVGTDLIDTIRHKVNANEERQTLRFAHVPVALGEFDYRVEIEPIDGEKIPDNNQGSTTVIVEEMPPEEEEPPDEVDAVEVLLADGFPRWEYRYLRNLLDGRDRSVELQYVLARPESIDGLRPLRGRPANASRKFGDSLATSLPLSAKDWLGFDVIVLGDLPSNAISKPGWAAIEHAVSEKGALLIAIAGRHSMPHRFTNPRFMKLLPVSFTQARAALPAKPFRLAWTPDGEESRILEVAEDSRTSREVWEKTPPFTWRQGFARAKRNAKTLAYAVPPNRMEAAAYDPDQLAKDHPLIVSQRIGAGRVVFFHFDSTWRLRYGADDRYHHRFWWQVLHWKVEPEEEEPPVEEGGQIELSTDQESYHLGDPIHIKAKLSNPDHSPVTGAALRIQVMRDGLSLFTQSMQARASSPGVYDAALETPLPDPGIYEFVLQGDDAFDQLLQVTGDDIVKTPVTIQPDAGLELQQLTTDHAPLRHLAELSGGRFCKLPEAGSLSDLFGPRKLIDRRIEETTLWDNHLLLILFVSLLTLEWILRRVAGLV